MVNYTSCATTSESTGVSTVLELLIVGIDGELLVSGSELLIVSISTVTRQKNSNVHDQLSFNLLHILTLHRKILAEQVWGGRSPPSARLW